MDKDQISMLLLMNMNRFHNLIKIVNSEKFKTEKTLTDRQFFALSSIMKHKKIELKNLSKDLYVSTSSLCILLNKLVERGFVYREEDPRDRRNTFYGITQEGLNVVNAEIDELVEIINKKLDVLSEEDLNKLAKSMDEIKNIMDKLF
ncbi:MAG: MarR family winged helix-turn-helix transcriptional regulator [Peptostreptococcaceae bacterium]